MRRSRLWPLFALAALGCGSTPSTAEVAERPPLVDEDPPPFVPGEHTAGGERRALVLGSRRDEARAVALRFVAALRDGDPTTLEAMLAEHIGGCFPSLTPPQRAREQVVALILANPQRVALGPEVPLDTLVDLDRVEMRLLREENRHLPMGFEPDDVMVSFPLRPDGRQSLRAVLPGWTTRGIVVVRPGATPQIVAL